VLPAVKRSYSFPGSHLLVSFSPDDRYVATTTQEKEVHVWRVADASDLRMSGYYAKVRSLAWTADARWLLTSGADTAIAWGFDGSGPEGKPPRMLGPDTESHVSCVACHPKLPLVAIGYADGAIALARVGKPARELPVREPRASPVTALAFAPDGQRLAAGTQDGLALLYDFDHGSKPSA
jgi:WD40 repeat protein